MALLASSLPARPRPGWVFTRRWRSPPTSPRLTPQHSSTIQPLPTCGTTALVPPAGQPSCAVDRTAPTDTSSSSHCARLCHRARPASSTVGRASSSQAGLPRRPRLLALCRPPLPLVAPLHAELASDHSSRRCRRPNAVFCHASPASRPWPSMPPLAVAVAHFKLSTPCPHPPPVSSPPPVTFPASTSCHWQPSATISNRRRSRPTPRSQPPPQPRLPQPPPPSATRALPRLPQSSPAATTAAAKPRPRRRLLRPAVSRPPRVQPRRRRRHLHATISPTQLSAARSNRSGHGGNRIRASQRRI